VKLFEFQGKELFASAGIPIPASRLVRIVEPDGIVVPGGSSGAAARVQEAAENVASEAGAQRVVVKAQLDMGGRGKAGLIKVAEPTAAAAAATEILATGYTIPALLIEAAAPIQRELYLSISAEPETARYVVLASAEGGMEIEELAQERPEAIKRISIDPFRGLQPYQSRGLAYDLGLNGSAAKAFAVLLGQLYRVFQENDAELAEINPIFVTGSEGGDVPPLIAGDAKVIIDDNSLDRQPRFQRTREQYDSDAAFEAAQEGIPYVQFDGDIS
jgi:succinyl-CoA synthetase beta subunit